MTAAYDNEYRRQRMVNLEALAQAGYAPYGGRFERSGRLDALRAAYAEGQTLRIAGRLATVRDMGKSLFADLNDGSGRLQVYLTTAAAGEAALAAFRRLDLGDTIGVEGTTFTTRTGEPSLRVTAWTLLAKALLPPPEKWHGLKDVEARYRQRYLDLAANPAVRALFLQRAAMVHEIRAFLMGRGFVEVETPMLQAAAGGAAARPFRCRYEALDTDVFLRIAPELFLKRLLVGGYDKVFELNRNFRNEGLSRTHNPEFTMLEIYEAYTDVRGMRDLIQDLIVHVAQAVFGTLTVGEDACRVDLTPPWREATYRDLVREAVGTDWFDLSLDEARRRAATEGLALDPGMDMPAVTHEVYEKRVEPRLIAPTFVTRLPAPLIPLARACPDDPSLADVFELVIRGQEIAPAYTELNDPIEQRRRLTEQAGADPTRVDEDFLVALEHGMPPAGGMGVGIDRLMMILSGAEAIRDVILFPQLKPKP